MQSITNEFTEIVQRAWGIPDCKQCIQEDCMINRSWELDDPDRPVVEGCSRYKKSPTQPWEMTRDAWATYIQNKRCQSIEAWNDAGAKGFPPTVGIETIATRITLGERAGYELPREADKLLRISYHELTVRAAIAEGQPVPSEVLADYPHLVSLHETKTFGRREQ